MTPVQAASYLAAMIDGEGSVCFMRAPSGRPRVKTVRIWNTDIGIILAIEEACEVLGIAYLLRAQRTNEAKGHKPAWAVIISRGEDFRLLHQKVRLRSYKKAARLAEIVKSIKYIRQAAFCPSGHPFTGDNLYLTVKGGRRCRACRRESMRPALATA